MPRELDWDGRDPPSPDHPRRRRPGPAPIPGLAVALPAVAWGLMALAVVLGGAACGLLLLRADSPIDRAVLPATYAAGVVAAYALARAADRLAGLLAGRG